MGGGRRGERELGRGLEREGAREEGGGGGVYRTRKVGGEGERQERGWRGRGSESGGGGTGGEVSQSLTFAKGASNNNNWRLGIDVSNLIKAGRETCLGPRWDLAKICRNFAKLSF